jgi:hypothetical protein
LCLVDEIAQRRLRRLCGIRVGESLAVRSGKSVPVVRDLDTQAAIAVLIAITACLCVAYWRMALRIVLIVVIALAVFGAVADIDGVTSLMAQHHR